MLENNKQIPNENFAPKMMFWIRVIYLGVTFLVFLCSTIYPIINSVSVIKNGTTVDALIKIRIEGNYSGGLGTTCFFIAKTRSTDSILSIHNSAYDFRRYKPGDIVSVTILKDSPNRFLFNDIYDRVYFPLQGLAFTVLFSGLLYLMWIAGTKWFPNIGDDD